MFENWLDQHFPEKKDKVLSRIRELRGGELNDPRFGSRMRGEGTIAEAVKQMYKVTYKKLAFPGKGELSTAAFRRPNDTPTSLFD